MPPRLQLTHVSKRYPGVLANDDVSLTVQPGEIHAVLGENGAGKSTLMKIIYGAVKPDAGELRFDDRPVHIGNPQQARQLGIAMVFQHFSLFETLSVAENVWLGLDKSLALAEVARRIGQTAAAYGLDIDPARPVHTLSVGEMQRVEIIRALLAGPRLLILDEPTSVLTPQAVERLFVTLRQLAAEGCSILYISHKLHEIRALCTACTVMRAGRVTGVCDPRQESNASLSRLMIGAEPPALAHHERTPGAPVLSVQGLDLKCDSPFGVDLVDISLQVRAGEVLGIAGVSGNGQRELLFALSGEDQRAPAASISIANQAAGRLPPSRRRALGLHFVPEERLGRGAVPEMGLAHNLLSGGNLQKFIMGREIDARPKLLVVSQPTWGVDVGAAAQIRGELLALRDAGCAVLVVSEELDELFEVCDRLHVIAKGRLSPAIARRDATVERIGEWMSGLWHGEVQQHLQQVEAGHAAA